jgi:hypothetical protein
MVTGSVRSNSTSTLPALAPGDVTNDVFGRFESFPKSSAISISSMSPFANSIVSACASSQSGWNPAPPTSKFQA